MGFEFLDFATADVAFRAYGKTLGELFASAGLALFEVMTDIRKVEPKVRKEIRLEAEDLEELMFLWLSELLFFVDTEGLLFSEFDVDVRKDGKWFLEAVCRGERIDPERHELRTAVKSPSFHGMKVEKNGEWRALVIVDV